VTTKVLIESAQTATKTSTGRFRAILAVPGKGSSGTYSAEMLKRYGPVAFPPGMKAYINHDEKRDARDLLGHYPEGAVWDENEGAEGALVSELEPLPSKVDFVEEVAPHVALSLFALGKADTAGNITELIYHRTNGVDMVGYGGLEGSKLGEKISEAALSLLQERAAASADHEREEESMTPEEMKALLAEVLAPVFTFVSEQKQAAEAARLAAEEADKGDKAPTVKEAVAAYATESEKVKAEKLFPTQEAAILAELAEGKDISKLLEDAKKIRDEATTTITESFSSTGGRRVDTGSDSEAYGLGMAW
jgi:hypothetical protein